MNLHPSSLSGGIYRVGRVLSLVLLQHVLAAGHLVAGVHSRLPTAPDSEPIASVQSYPYLKIAGALPLRFGIAPPSPFAAAKVSATAQTSAPAVSSAATTDVVKIPTQAGEKPAELSSAAPAIESATTIPTNAHQPTRIIPDDTHPATHPEDFLPFFQFPAGNGVTLVVPATTANAPAAGQLPASSATYQQR